MRLPAMLAGGPAAPLWPIAIARILMGALWLLSLRWKLPPDFDGGSERSLREWLELEVEHPTVGLYGSIIESFVLPNFTVFAWLLFVTELAVGLSLLTGALTRVGAFVGTLLSLNLGIGLASVPGEWPWSYAMMAMWHGTLFVAGAGRLWGVDGWWLARIGATGRRDETVRPARSEGRLMIRERVWR